MCLIQGKVVLRIGQHELKGSVVKLDKPLAVAKKITGSSSGVEASEITDSAKMAVDGEQNTSYEVVGVVRSKYLFKDRPKVLLESS